MDCLLGFNLKRQPNHQRAGGALERQDATGPIPGSNRNSFHTHNKGLLLLSPTRQDDTRSPARSAAEAERECE